MAHPQVFVSDSFLVRVIFCGKMACFRYELDIDIGLLLAP